MHSIFLEKTIPTEIGLICSLSVDITLLLNGIMHFYSYLSSVQLLRDPSLSRYQVVNSHRTIQMHRIFLERTVSTEIGLIRSLYGYGYTFK
jgi:hypothetical protein